MLSFSILLNVLCPFLQKHILNCVLNLPLIQLKDAAFALSSGALNKEVSKYGKLELSTMKSLLMPETGMGKLGAL